MFFCITGCKVEKAMKDHEVVPAVVVEAIAALHHGGCHKILGELIKYRLVAYEKGGRQGMYYADVKSYHSIHGCCISVRMKTYR